LKLAAQLVGALALSAGVIINRDNRAGTPEVDSFCREQGLPILMRIPLERAIAEGTARGQTLIDIQPEYRPRFQAMFNLIVAHSRVPLRSGKYLGYQFKGPDEHVETLY
jgi:MinD superfamily P-loop ATPase